MLQNNEWASDFVLFAACCNASGVRYLVVGGYAVGVHGYLRGTHDFDMWVEKTADNAQKLVQACIQFGIAADTVSADMFMSSKRFVEIGDAPFLIQIMNLFTGAPFDEAYARKKEVWVDETAIAVLALEDLIRNKEIAGREKDWQDIRALRKKGSDSAA